MQGPPSMDNMMDTEGFAPPTMVAPEAVAPQDQPSMVAPGNTAMPVGGPAAKARAARYNIAMGEQSMGADAIEHVIRTGGEPNLQAATAASEESRLRQVQSEKFISLATSGEFNANAAYQAYQQYTQPVRVSPETVMEDTFGTNYLKMIFGANATIDELRKQAALEDPKVTMAALDGSQRLLARQALAVKNLEDAEQASGSWFNGNKLYSALPNPLGGILGNVNVPKVLNTIGSMFPVAPAVNTAGPENRSIYNTVFPGDYLIEARRKFWSFRDLDEANKWLKSETARIAKFNPEDAVNFARAMVDYSLDEKWVANAIGVTDVTPVGAIGAGAKMAASTKFVHALTDTLRGVKASTRMEDVFVSVGDVQHAGEVLLAKRATLNKNDPLGLADAIRELPWSRNPDLIIERNPGTMAAEYARKLSMVRQQAWAEAVADLNTSSRVQRVPKEAHDPMLKDVTERIHQEFPSTNDYVINDRLRYEPLNNSYYGETMLGERDGTWIKSVNRAERVAQDELGLKPEQYKIVNIFGDQPGDVIGINSAGMSKTKALDPTRAANKVEGFNSIQGTVRLKDGTEVKVSNRKDGIFRQDTKEALNPSDIAAYKNSAKGSTWTNVPSESKKKAEGIFKGSKVRQDGLGYYISIIRAADETIPAARAALLTTENTAPVSLANYWLGGLLRSAEDQVPYFQRMNRHIATHAPNAMLSRIAEMAKPIGKLNSDSFDALNAVLIRNRDFHETVNGELIRGRAFKSQAALEKEWIDVNKRPPTFQESNAYWTYHQIMDLDWTIRNIGVHRDLARVGVSERYTIGIGEEGKTVSHPGKFVPKIDWNHHENPGIVVIEAGKPVEFMYAGKTTADVRKHVDSLISENGYRAIMVANPVDRPYRDNLGSGATVNIVVAKDVTSSALPMNLVDRNPGVHVIYPHPWFAKQPIVTDTGEKGRKNYYGDLTALGADTEQEAKRISKALNGLQKLFKDDPEKANRLGIENYINKNLPRDYDFWHEKFYGKEGVEPHFSLDHPFLPTYSGRQTMELHRDLKDLPQYKDLHNERNSSFNLMRSIDMDFMADRNAPLMQIVNKGSMEKPVWDLEKARVLDPMASIERATANSVRQLYLNDVKASAIEQWARQFGKYLTRPELAETNPFQAFYHGEFVKDAMNVRELQAAKNTQKRILNFIGTQTELGRDLHWFNQMTMNMIENMENTKVLGQPLLKEGSTRYYNDHELRFVKDPIAFFRSLLFTAKFGLPINFKQFFVQAQGFSNVLGIMSGAHGPIQGPKMTAQAMAAYAFQRGRDLTENLNITNAMANKLAAWGWDKKQYIEASQWMKDDGWKIVGNEHAYRDAFDPELITHKGRNILKAYPFYEGERLTRMVSGYASYLEWRKANPTAVFDDFAKSRVLVRADDLATNMTRASNSGIQEGGFRLPSQFYTFSHRLLEQYWGKRLTVAEKAGLFATQSVLYGVPAALGAATFLPIYEWVRTQMLTESQIGIGPLKVPVNMNDKWLRAVTEGFIHYSIWHTTGRSYDIQGRYGPGPSDQLLQSFTGERHPLDVGMGATGTFIKDMASATVGPAYRSLYTMIRGGDEQYQVTWNDIKPLISQFAVFNDYGNALVMYNTGKYLSRQGRLLGENLDGFDAAALVLGAQRREIKDANLILGALADQTKVQNAAMTNAIREMRIAFQYMRDGDMTKGDVHLANANVYAVVFGDLQDEQMREMRRRVGRELGTLIEEANAQLLRRGYKSQIPARLKRIIGED